MLSDDTKTRGECIDILNRHGVKQDHLGAELWSTANALLMMEAHDAEQRAEIERLRARVAELEAHLNPPAIIELPTMAHDSTADYTKKICWPPADTEAEASDDNE